MPPHTLTLDALIARLEAKRARYGGALPVYVEAEGVEWPLGVDGVGYQGRGQAEATAPGIYMRATYATLSWQVRQACADAQRRDNDGETVSCRNAP